MNKKIILTKDDVLHIAKLAKLTLSESEVQKFQVQLTEILSYFQKLQEIDTESVVATSHVTGLENIMREDTHVASRLISQSDSISGAKKQHNGLFRVSAIFENDVDES